MKSIEKLETTVARWLEPLPHLPTSARKWIAQNIWWMIMVGVILSVIGILAMIGGILTTISLLGTTVSVYGYYIAPAYTGWFVFSLIVSLAFTIATVALIAMAINPLKVYQKEGWKLLFWAFILRVVAIVINAIFTFNASDSIWTVINGAVGIIIGVYLLYEIRSYFNISVKSKVTSKK